METLIHRQHVRHPVSASEDVGALRRAVAALASSQRALRTGEAELVATELGTNLLKHAAAGGYVLYRPTSDGVEFLSVDTGPGMAARGAPRAAEAVRSSGVGLSAGLATIEGMATDYDCYSDSSGTVLLARLGGGQSGARGRWRHGAVDVPLGGTGPSGDAWAVTTGERFAAVVVDGLGHGDQAAVAAQAAVAEFDRRPVIDHADFLGRAHDAMHGTRGGVAATCVIDPAEGRLTFAGIGNIAGQIVFVDDKKQHLLSHPGTLGTQLSAPRVHVKHHRWSPDATLIMVSDGIRSGWDVSAYPGLLRHDPSVIAAVIHRDFTRTNDDATVLVAQEIT